MLSFVSSCGLTGIEGFAVDVEVNMSHGMVLFEIVGLPDASVKESGSGCARPSRTAASISRRSG